MKRAFLFLVFAIACTQPTPKKNKDKTTPKTKTATSTNVSAASDTTKPTEPEASNSSEPTTQKDLKLTVNASAPAKEPTPITPQKTDPECEAKGSSLTETENASLFNAYIEIQKEYLSREKGVKNFKMTPDPQNKLSTELSFQDLFGNAAKMKYTFGRSIAAPDGKITLCLDEGSILLWAGTYRRDTAKGFVPDL